MTGGGTQAWPCHICGSRDTEAFDDDLRLVSSDVHPVNGRVTWLLCRHCGCVQKQIDQRWKDMIADIYSSYAIYHQMVDSEQLIFSEDFGAAPVPRSQLLLRRLADFVVLPESGDVLDFGCANGILLRNFHKQFPLWRLTGVEITEKFSDNVLAIGGNVAYYGDGRSTFDRQFDLIILNHVLEHIENPIETLRKLRGQLKPDGVLCIAVPRLDGSPFDLLIADHCTHFRPAQLETLLRKAGFDLRTVNTTWFPKEILAVATPRAGATDGPADLAATAETVAETREVLRAHLAWLSGEKRRLAVLDRPFAVFGSSIAACWCLAEFADRIAHFVDEDAARGGQQLENKPIYLPQDAPAGLPLYFALAPATAAKVAARLANLTAQPLIPEVS